MSKKITMQLPPMVGVDDDTSLSSSGIFLTPKQKQEQRERQESIKRQEELKIQEELKRQEELKIQKELERVRRKVSTTLEQVYPQIPSSSAPATIGLISATLARHRARHAAYEKQLKFYNLLETKYGAVKGNDHSYMEALDRYHNDKERKEEERKHQSAIEKRETERRKKEKDERNRREKEEQEEYIRAQEQEIERQRQENMHHEQMRQQRRQQQEREDSYWQQRQQQQQHHQQQQQHHQQQQQHHHQQQQQQQQQQQRSYAHQGYARGGPAEEPQLSPRSRLSRRYPSPKTKRDALAILEFDPRGDPTQREIKKAFNKMAIRLHPDKNMDKPDEASVLFKQLHSAYKLLRPQGGGGGGVSRHVKRKYKGKMSKSRKYKITKRRK